MDRAGLRTEIQRLYDQADRLHTEIGLLSDVNVIAEMPSDDDADELRETIRDGSRAALSLRGVLQNALDELPSDWG